MAGNSGKMTNEAIAARGPRMVLARLCNTKGVGMLVIYREGQEPFKHGTVWVGVLARSYSLSYLRRVGKGNK